MWTIFTIFLLLWIASIELHFPVALTIAFFAFVIGTAAVALMPRPEDELSD